MAGFATGMGSHADMFLKIDGIEGESTDHAHKGEIELLGFSIGATQPASSGIGGGGGVGKVQLQDFHFTKHHDKASPKLFEACCTGKHTPKVTLTCRKAGGSQQEFLKWTLSEVLISSVQFSGSRERRCRPTAVRAVLRRSNTSTSPKMKREISAAWSRLAGTSRIIKRSNCCPDFALNDGMAGPLTGHANVFCAACRSQWTRAGELSHDRSTTVPIPATR